MKNVFKVGLCVTAAAAAVAVAVSSALADTPNPISFHYFNGAAPYPNWPYFTSIGHHTGGDQDPFVPAVDNGFGPTDPNPDPVAGQQAGVVSTGYGWWNSGDTHYYGGNVPLVDGTGGTVAGAGVGQNGLTTPYAIQSGGNNDDGQTYNANDRLMGSWKEGTGQITPGTNVGWTGGVFNLPTTYTGGNGYNVYFYLHGTGTINLYSTPFLDNYNPDWGASSFSQIGTATISTNSGWTYAVATTPGHWWDPTPAGGDTPVGTFVNGTSSGTGNYVVMTGLHATSFDWCADATLGVSGFQIVVPPPVPVTPTWQGPRLGDWNVSSNWNVSPAPNGANVQAVLNNVSGQSQMVATFAPIILGELDITGSNRSTIAGSGDPGVVLTMQNTGGSAAQINVSGGVSHELLIPLTFASNADVVVASGSTLEVGQPVTVNSGLTVSLSGAVQLDSWLSVASGGTLQQNGAFAGSGPLVKNGPGTLILSGNNTYAGGTAVNAGTLIAASSQAIPNGSSLTVGANAGSIFGASATSAPATSALSAVPEPGTLVLLAAGALLGACGAWRRRR